MQIQKSSRGDLLTLSVEGVLDNESAIHFRDAIDEHVRAGWHRIVLDLGGVPYMSSAGMGVLLASRKQLEGLHGLFGICNLTPGVEQVLQQTRILNLLVCDPDKISVTASRASMTWQSETRIFSDEVAGYELYEEPSEHPFRAEVIGRPQTMRSGSFTKGDCRQVEFPAATFGFGLGALGSDFEMSQGRFGEFLAVSGAVAQSSLSVHGLPDFLVSQEDFTPSAQVLYGIKCSGDFSQLIRFDVHNAAQPLGLSGLVDQALTLTRATAGGIVILAECAGLVGTRLRKSPAEPVAAGGERFAFPEVRQWLSYGAEQIHRRSLALVVGVAQRADSKTPIEHAAEFLRPLDPSGKLLGHFHAAVFPYRPLKKRTLYLQPLANELFNSGTIQDVLHLLNDDRPVTGAGESQFVTGGCWVAPMSAEPMREKRR